MFAIPLTDVVSAAPSWTAPDALTNVTLFNLPTNNASIAVGPNDDSIAVWINESNYVVQYAQRKNGAWSTAQTVYSTTNALSLPKLSLGASGHALLAWQEKLIAGSSTPFAIRALYRDISDAWNPVEDAAGLSAQSWTLRSGMDASGQATLLWDNNYAVQLSRRTAINVSSPWSSAETLVSVPGTQYDYGGPFSAYAPDLSVNASGDILVGWLESDTTNGLWTIEAQFYYQSASSIFSISSRI